jgi:hypothetical protein
MKGNKKFKKYLKQILQGAVFLDYRINDLRCQANNERIPVFSEYCFLLFKKSPYKIHF